MTNWRVTAATIYCDAVDDDVTIFVYKDGATRCSGYRRYVELIDSEMSKMVRKKGKRLGRRLKCEGPQDYRVMSYRDKLSAEEKS